jgi:hypothetical protein
MFSAPRSLAAGRWADPVRYLGMLLALTMAACSGPEQIGSLEPPRQTDQIVALRHQEPTGEFLKANPKPDAVSLGCFEVHAREPVPATWRPLPGRIRLTSAPLTANPAAIQTSYWVESKDPNQPGTAFWSWTPLANHRATMSLSDGFSGWSLELASISIGFTGKATWYTDSAPIRHKPDIAVNIVRVACE